MFNPKELVCSWADKLCTHLQTLAYSSVFECQMCIINNMSWIGHKEFNFSFNLSNILIHLFFSKHVQNCLAHLKRMR